MTNDIAKFLKKVMDSQGLDYPWECSSETYELALKSRLLSEQDARILFYVLLGGLEFKKDIEALLNRREENLMATLSSFISENCHLDELTCDSFAEAIIQLYSPFNKEKWAAAEKLGFKEFCSRKWAFNWIGKEVWSADRVYVNCDAEASFTLKVTDVERMAVLVKPPLDKNPFVTAKSIFEFVSATLCRQLDDDFEYYCCCDDYYPPVVEDYEGNCESVVGSFCEDNGLVATDFTFEGRTGDYEPNI